jgi:hypothetical protein
MEAGMHKVAITGTLAILAVALLVPGRAEAGGSVSAPSKYGHASQVAAVSQVRTVRQVRRPEIGITEYSSSSRTPPYGHAYR